jgi:hypothetical protein
MPTRQRFLMLVTPETGLFRVRLQHSKFVLQINNRCLPDTVVLMCKCESERANKK